MAPSSGLTADLLSQQNKDHKLKCAVIVNDIGALNIDASLINQHSVVSFRRSAFKRLRTDLALFPYSYYLSNYANTPIPSCCVLPNSPMASHRLKRRRKSFR